MEESSRNKRRARPERIVFALVMGLRSTRNACQRLRGSLQILSFASFSTTIHTTCVQKTEAVQSEACQRPHFIRLVSGEFRASRTEKRVPPSSTEQPFRKK